MDGRQEITRCGSITRRQGYLITEIIGCSTLYSLKKPGKFTRLFMF